MFKTRQKFGDSFLTIVQLLVSENTVRKIVKLVHIEHFGLSKKAALVSNFFSIGKIHHNFLVPRMIELGCKTFMPFQTSDLHRVTRGPLEELSIFNWWWNSWSYQWVLSWHPPPDRTHPLQKGMSERTWLSQEFTLKEPEKFHTSALIGMKSKNMNPKRTPQKSVKVWSIRRT